MDATIPSQFDNLLRDLREGALEKRVKAAHDLREYGSLAVEPLCYALWDHNIEVRLVAVESLKHIGDVRAIQPLMMALQGYFVRRSARWQLVIGLTLTLIIIGFIGGLIGGNIVTILGPAVLLVWSILGVISFSYFILRRAQSKMCQAIVESLVCIAERNPTPELRKVLPDLKAIAADVIHQARKARSAARHAAQRIEALTEQIKNLPLPASAPAPDAAMLPRAADAPAPDVETLPRVVEE